MRATRGRADLPTRLSPPLLDGRDAMTPTSRHMLALCGAAAIAMLPGGASARELSIPFLAANFPNMPVISNNFFPLVPGATFTYEAETTDGCEVDVTIVTNDTRMIDGVATRIVHDTAY